MNVTAALVGVAGLVLGYLAFRQDRAIIGVSAYRYSSIPFSIFHAFHPAAYLVTPAPADDNQRGNWVVLEVVNSGKRAIRIEGLTVKYRGATNAAEVKLKRLLDIPLNEDHRRCIIAFDHQRLIHEPSELIEMEIIDDSGRRFRVKANEIREPGPTL